MCAYISHLYPSSVDGHLCCLHILEIVNNIVMSIEVNVPLQICVFVFDVYPGVEFLGHRIGWFLVFWEASILFSTGAVPFALPPTVQEASLFTRSSWTSVTCVLFVDGVLAGVVWYLTAALIFISQMISSVDHLSMRLLAICISSLKKCLFLLFIFLKITSFVFDVKLYELFIYVGY